MLLRPEGRTPHRRNHGVRDRWCQWFGALFLTVLKGASDGRNLDQPSAVEKTGLDSVENLGFEASIFEGVDFLDAGWTRNIHLGEKTTNDVDSDKKQAISTEI